MTTAGFPFSAVVGQDEAKLALVLNAVDPAIGGVLLRGHKGSAKSTLARGLAALLPGDAPFVELPVGASEDRVVGSLDLGAALSGDGVKFEPGLLAAAHGGVLYIDEVNLLPDHLVDVLLDVAAGGVNRVEREGVSHAHPSRFVLVGSMNPEEGDLRPQLLDRFGFAVDVMGSEDARERAEAVRRRLAFDGDPAGFLGEWQGEESALAALLGAARPARLDDELVVAATSLCAAVGAEGLRADLVICRGAAALAGLEGRDVADDADVRRVARLALSHRRRRSPFEEPGIDQQTVDDALEEGRRRRSGAGSGEGEGEAPEGHPAPPRSGDPARGDAEPGDAGPGGAGDTRTVAPGAVPEVTALGTERLRGSAAPGRRSLAEGPRGRVVGDRVPTPPAAELSGLAAGGVAVAATLRAAATRAALVEEPVRVTLVDVREAVRVERVGNLVVLVVDASSSMHAGRRMEAVKGAIVGLLLDAYQRRDRVALVTFRGDSAEVVLRPTGSVEVARARLAELPTGGRTPLAAGIEQGLRVALSAPSGDGAHRALLVVVSDGRATAASGGEDPLEAAHRAAAGARSAGVRSVVVDAEDGHARLGLARELAATMGARYVALNELDAGSLCGAITSTLRVE